MTDQVPLQAYNPAILYPCSMADLLLDPPHPVYAVNRPLAVSLKQILTERAAAFIEALISSVWEFVVFQHAIHNMHRLFQRIQFVQDQHVVLVVA